MTNEIFRQILRFVPDAIAIVSITALMVAVWCTSRVITINHYTKHHMDAMVSQEIKEKERYVDMLEDENGKMLSELKRLRITMKIMRNALIIKDVD